MQLHFSDRESWRAWLKQHHGDEREIWLILYKKHTGKHTIPYAEAIEEALCFGWIDSIIKKLDDQRYLCKFTQRTNNAKWSALNLERVRRLVQSRRMAQAGLAKLDPGVKAETPPAKREFPMPSVLKRLLGRNKRARENFERLAPSYRRNYIAWIANAKQPETQERRAEEAVRLLERNQKLGLK